MRVLIGIIVFLLFGSNTIAQEKNIFYGIDKDIVDKIDIRPLPDEGHFITIQIAVMPYKYGIIGRDDIILSKFMMIKPVYYKVTGENLHLSVGLFNTPMNSSETERELDKIFQGAFKVPYSNGKRISFSNFEQGNLPQEEKPDFDKIRKRLKKLIKKDYFRVQVGYYEQKGYTESEQKKIDILKENGYILKEEKDEKGRYLVVKKKYKTWDEARIMEKEVERLIGDYCFVRRYHHYKEVKYYHVHYLIEMYEALTE